MFADFLFAWIVVCWPTPTTLCTSDSHWLNDSNQWNSKQCFRHQRTILSHTNFSNQLMMIGSIHASGVFCKHSALFPAKRFFLLEMIAVNTFVRALNEQKRKRQKKRSTLSASFALWIWISIGTSSPLCVRFVNTPWILIPHFNRWFYFGFLNLFLFLKYQLGCITMRNHFNARKKMVGYERKTFTS